MLKLTMYQNRLLLCWEVINLNAQDLKNSILQLAVQGKLVEQRPEEGTAKELLAQIKAEKEQLTHFCDLAILIPILNLP